MMPVVMIYELAGVVVLQGLSEFVEELDELGGGFV